MGTIVGGGKSFRRQKTRDRPPPPTLYPPPLGVVFSQQVTTGSVWGYLLLLGICVGVLVVLYIGYMLVVGGIYFFIKIFVESNSRELPKTENK